MSAVPPGDNYSAWRVEEKDFPRRGTLDEKIKFLLQFAILAPSAFNAQPWICNLSNGKLVVYLDRSRMLTKSDTLGRFAFIAAGCFLKNLEVAANHYGLSAQVSIRVKRLESRIEVARVGFREDSKKVNKDFKMIKVRATNRSQHKPQDVPDMIVSLIKKMDDSSHRVVVFKPDLFPELVSLSKKAAFDVWGDKDKRLEHSTWVRHNLTKAFDGMPAFGVGIGLFPSFVSKRVMRSSMFAKIQAKKDSQAIFNSRNFVSILGKDMPEEWIKTGFIFEGISLTLAGKGVSVAPMGTFIESPEAREDLNQLIHKRFKPKLELKPQLLFRIGYPIRGVLHSPRLPVEKILRP